MSDDEFSQTLDRMWANRFGGFRRARRAGRDWLAENDHDSWMTAADFRRRHGILRTERMDTVGITDEMAEVLPATPDPLI